MLKLDKIFQLEKESNVSSFALYDYISDITDEKNNVRKRILKSRTDNRYFYHEMKNGEKVKCFEMALEREPFSGIYIFVFSLDNLHICEMDSRIPGAIHYRRLKDYQVKTGMTFNYQDSTFKLFDENSIIVNGKQIPVENSNSYIFKLFKKKIKAIGGAKGLFIFLENEARNNNYSVYINQFIEKYSA